ncbi:hypothetical protein KFL_004310030 [Klebsormidium nitens]|uniref:Uncharacterized protein n=1 Tax=Klebsormidium nitens TaxID=105231 RepID=A0A1Y1IBY0_KLENI|nr:hypothetical protein KFL_004310030 [Klebsormidium nitens]|eukprot:GAQ88465.1 hypothetical protein KFL_004310030 [Klebsormidium nitens]
MNAGKSSRTFNHFFPPKISTVILLHGFVGRGRAANMTMSTVMSCLEGSPRGKAAGYSPGAFLSSSLAGGKILHPSELLLNWPESWYVAPPDEGEGEGCACIEPACNAGECCDIIGLNPEGGAKDEDCSEGGGEFEKEDPSGGVVEPEEAWVLGWTADCPPLEGERCGVSQARLGFGGGALQCQASVLFRALVSTRASMHSKLRSRPISAVVSDWQMKWNWDLVLDKVSELNKRWAEHNGGGAKRGGGSPRGGVVAQWWKGVRRTEAGGKLTWRVLASGSWEVW